MKVATRRLVEEQIAVVVVLESGKKDDAMWHVPQESEEGNVTRLWRTRYLEFTYLDTWSGFEAAWGHHHFGKYFESSVPVTVIKLGRQQKISVCWLANNCQ